MKHQSGKAKGRRLQKFVRDVLRTLGKPLGLEDADIESRGMGQAGLDIILSPAARKVFPYAIECKMVEKLQVFPTFCEHYRKYEGVSDLKLLVHSKNHSPVLVTLMFSDLINLLKPRNE